MAKKASKKGGRENLLNVSELARRSGLNRETVREKLQRSGVKPKRETSRLKLYDADEALRALEVDGTTGLRQAQTAKTAAEAERAQLKLDKERGDLVSIHDVRNDLQELIKAIHQHFVVTSPAALSPQLRGKTVSQIEAALKRDAENFFSELRAKHESYL